MKKLMSLRGLVRLSAVMPSNAFSADPNRQRKTFELNSATAELAGTGAVSLRLPRRSSNCAITGSFQSYDDLNELELPKDQMDKLRWNTTIQGIASDQPLGRDLGKDGIGGGGWGRGS